MTADAGPSAGGPAHVVIAGSSGLIGRSLASSLRADGVRVTRLVRRTTAAPDEVRWLDGTDLDPTLLASADAVVNLCGASVGRLPWTRSYRRVLRDSRLIPTRALAAAIARLGERPLLVSASASGFYGSRPGAAIDERQGAGSGFLAELCVAWEDAARGAGAHVALLRTAPVVHPDGVLKPLIPLAGLGLAGPLGSGRQHWSWISLDDEVAAIRHILLRRLTGAFNLASPEPVTERAFVAALAERLHRPFWLPAPAFALRAVLGRDFADAMLLGDAAVIPRALQESGFAFTHRTIDEALAAALPRPDRPSPASSPGDVGAHRSE